MKGSPSQKERCSWCGRDELYVHYHDTEWGVPVFDDEKLFEYLLLETFQAGLSWITILRKRENFRIAFDGFDYRVIAQYSESKIAELLNNSGIIRHRKKIEAAIVNAQSFMLLQEEFGSFSHYIWQFTDGKVIQNAYYSLSEIPAQTELSVRISKDLKKRGFKFIGPTVVYAHMQATGMVNDHSVACFRYCEVRNISF
jgi:DNA-3-methyladenine glycosylase I